MGDKRTYADRRAYIARKVSERRKLLRKEAVYFLGGSCCICGYDKYIGALEFHHIDPNEKEFGLSSRGLTRSWEKIVEELKKCVLVCSNCHREIHAGVTQLPLETTE
ncbi:hypothetical protein CO180_03375 [candidate division WWE3 bacterium CG_4_9_14_3_um_filter_41_6]|uniref:HNH nuclease domain-containing protein n=1 Tax=candidate division WWE3 bacterium CG_4_10_14_0_2_um_filter_41_14 TaxID=1975072 RepID=A0A2M7TM61_UNCKA|nr:MAG: hypothetical protein COY32_00250 [candidate division WWE3 bacterium CG_4_10_14_0_2_um_filter_41_14]PJA38518.1 MAG: hypothetical protein CO180_03375 [candidate division WWE3 bacterium CG_4_9_14_3_um_filter_41_6]